jgi:hypothetical protein
MLPRVAPHIGCGILIGEYPEPALGPRQAFRLFDVLAEARG